MAAVETLRQVDVTPLLSEIQCPTVLIHRRGAFAPSVDVARRMALQIPNARLVILEGDSLYPTPGDTFRTVLQDAVANPPSHPRPASAPEHASLPPRRLRVLELAADGLTNDEIAERLHLSSSTVKKHLHSAFRQLGASNRAGAVAAARRLGLLE